MEQVSKCELWGGGVKRVSICARTLTSPSTLILLLHQPHPLALPSAHNLFGLPNIIIRNARAI